MRPRFVKHCVAGITAHLTGLRSAGTALIVIAVVALGGCASDDDGLTTGAGPEGVALVSCGPGGPTFPRSALDTLHDAPHPDQDTAQGMQSFLESEEGAFWPQEGWRVLSSTDGVTVLLADADSQLWFQTLELSDGAWRWSGSSATDDCPLRVVAPEGYNEVVWRLDPDQGTPTSSSTDIDVLVHETACAGGEPVGDRLVGPDVEVAADEVRVGFVAETQDGAFSCPGNPETPVTIHLEEPLGERELVDAHDLGTDLRAYL